MPYRHANYFLFFLLIVTVWGFWESYFTKIGTVPLAFHVHAFTATLWVMLVMAQVWSIHNRKHDLHSVIGKTSFALFPFLLVGFVMIINVSADRFAAADNPFSMHVTPSFGFSMVFAIVAYMVLFDRALQNRKKLHLHSGYMLATPLVLFESPFSRVVLDDLPFLVFTGAEGSQRLLDVIVSCMILSVLIALVLYLRNRKQGEPWIVVAILMSLQAVTMAYGGNMEWSRDLFGLYAQVPHGISIAVGFLLGSWISWRGWNSIRPHPKPAAAQ